MNEEIDDILKQYEENKAKKDSNKKQTNTTNGLADLTKRYFSDRIDKKEEVDNKEVTVRILKGVTKTFEEGFFHEIKVNGKYERLYCPEKNDGNKCPICYARKKLYETKNELDAQLAKTFYTYQYYICKLIERGKESDGVKFYRFKHSKKGDGVMDKMIPLFSKYGKNYNDPINGYDISLNLTKTNKGETNESSKIVSILYDKPCKLTDVEADYNEWTSNTETWRDAFKPKSEAYLMIVANGKTPVWDKDSKTHVAKEDIESTDVKTNDGVKVNSEIDKYINSIKNEKVETDITEEKLDDYTDNSYDDLPF